MAVLTALESEYDAVRRQLTDLRVFRHPAGTLFEIGGVAGAPQSIVIGMTGLGSTSSAVVAERVISHFQPQAILFVGVAAAISAELEPGDVVVATAVRQYHRDGDEDGSRARSSSWEAPHGLEQLARHLARNARWIEPSTAQPKIHFSPIAAVDRLLDAATEMRHRYGDVVAIEMEGAGVAQAGRLNEWLPVLTIRGISDKADGRKSTAAAWAAAATNAAKFSVDLATEIVDSSR